MKFIRILTQNFAKIVKFCSISSSDFDEGIRQFLNFLKSNTLYYIVVINKIKVNPLT